MPKPDGCPALLFRFVLKGLPLGLVLLWIWDHWALWFHQPYHAYSWPVERYVIIGTVAAMGALAWWANGWFSTRGLFRDWKFRLMRIESIKSATKLPIRLTTAPHEDARSGFRTEFSAEFRNNGPGDLAVGVYSPANQRSAIIHLRHNTKLPVTSWTTFGYFEQALPRMSPDLATLVSEFAIECDRFQEIQPSLRRTRDPASGGTAAPALPPDPTAA